MTVLPETFLGEDYELERGKPMPSFNHYYVQSQLHVALHAACGDRFFVGGELSLATEQTTTPDISICNFDILTGCTMKFERRTPHLL